MKKVLLHCSFVVSCFVGMGWDDPSENDQPFYTYLEKYLSVDMDMDQKPGGWVGR